MRNRVCGPEDSHVLVLVAAAAISAGDIVKIGGRFGVAQNDIAVGASGSVQTRGRFKLAKQSATVLAQGQAVGWDFANERITTDLGSGKLGFVAEAAGSGTTTVEVELENAAQSIAHVLTAAGTALTGTASETSFLLTSAPVIPANSLAAGDIVEIEGFVVVTGNNGTDTLVVKGYVGATEVFAIAALDPNTGIAYFRVATVVRTAGASGTCVAMGDGCIAPSGSGTGTMTPLVKGSQALDTTVDNTVDVKGTWSSNSGTNSAAIQGFTMTVKRKQ